jgi:hypothetical protein
VGLERPVSDEAKSRDREGVSPRRLRVSALRLSLVKEEEVVRPSRRPREARAEEVDGERPAPRARASVESPPVSPDPSKWER